MSKDTRMTMPSSQGGLMRYDSAGGSSIQIPPQVVVGLAVAVVVGLVAVHVFLRV